MGLYLCFCCAVLGFIAGLLVAHCLDRAILAEMRRRGTVR